MALFDVRDLLCPELGHLNTIRLCGFLRGGRFDSDFVIHGDSKLLLAAEVMFGRLDGHMPEQELDLVELTSG